MSAIGFARPSLIGKATVTECGIRLFLTFAKGDKVIVGSLRQTCFNMDNRGTIFLLSRR
jgi:hypothetical protein